MIWSSVSGPGVDHPGVRRAQRQQVVGHDRARVEAHRAPLEQAFPAHGDQIGRARAGADEVDGHRLVTDPLGDGHRAAPSGEAADGLTVIVLEPAQRRRPSREYHWASNGFGLHGDHVGDQPAADGEAVEAAPRAVRVG